MQTAEKQGEQMQIQRKHRWAQRILYEAEGASLKDVLEKAVREGADLGGAYLRGYSESHLVFFEAIRRQKVEVFSESEWAMIGQISIHWLCWNSIKTRFGEKMIRIFEVLAGAGFGEYLERYKKLLEENK